MRRLVLAFAAALALSLANLGLAVADTSVQVTDIPIPRAQCAILLLAAAQDTHLSKLQHEQFASVKDTECHVHMVSGVRPLPNDAAAGNVCGGFWRSMSLMGRWYSMGTVHTNVGLCWNYSTVWVGGSGTWGPNCPSEPTLGYWISMSWCGVWNSGGTYVQPGNNFDYGVCVSQWGQVLCYRWNGWMRYVVTNNGSAWNTVGGW